MLVIALFFLVGAGVGAYISVCDFKNAEISFKEDLIYSINNINPIKTVASSWVSVFFTIAVLWVSGFFKKIVSVVLCTAVITFKGVVTGYTVGMLNICYKIKGLFLAVSGILPQYVILLPLIFFAVLSAYSFCSKNISLKTYFVIFVCTVILGIIPAVTDGYLSGYLMKAVFTL
jgi:hypothetical protein